MYVDSTEGKDKDTRNLTGRPVYIHEEVWKKFTFSVGIIIYRSLLCHVLLSTVNVWKYT